MLSFAEEIFLLALDDVSGKIIPTKSIVLNSALIGAVIGELSFLNRIDTDIEYIYRISTEKTGDPILDDVLGAMEQMETEKSDISDCLSLLLPIAEKIEERVLKQLLDKEILKQVDDKILWIIPTRRYPIINDTEIKDVETRLRKLILSDEIPEPRETVLVSLVYACNLFPEILSPKEMRRSEERIEIIAKMDPVGQKVLTLINDINSAMVAVAPFI